ncbi:hypothetical protein [Comamonas sp. JC664]|uniref:hypothetical protein n=1 Tax=Comamonas sp. JC664 TaxID=2801917 RepID=UPI00361FF26F
MTPSILRNVFALAAWPALCVAVLPCRAAMWWPHWQQCGAVGPGDRRENRQLLQQHRGHVQVFGFDRQRESTR